MADSAPCRSFHAIVAENARRWPERVYVHCIDQDKSLTYGALHPLTNRIAGFLKEAGLRANDRVLLLAENSVENFAIFVGTLRYGATLATVHVEMNHAHLAEIVAAIAPKIVLYQEGLGLERLCEDAPGEWHALGEWRPDGGSTGFFKTIGKLPKDRDIPT